MHCLCEGNLDYPVEYLNALIATFLGKNRNATSTLTMSTNIAPYEINSFCNLYSLIITSKTILTNSSKR